MAGPAPGRWHRDRHRRARSERLILSLPFRRQHAAPRHVLLPPPHARGLQRKDGIMSLFGADVATLDDLFVHGLKTIYYAERQITVALPTMIEKASNPQLKAGFEQHLRETENQRVRLEQVFR